MCWLKYVCYILLNITMLSFHILSSFISHVLYCGTMYIRDMVFWVMYLSCCGCQMHDYQMYSLCTSHAWNTHFTLLLSTSNNEWLIHLENWKRRSQEAWAIRFGPWAGYGLPVALWNEDTHPLRACFCCCRSSDPTTNTWDLCYRLTFSGTASWPLCVVTIEYISYFNSCPIFHDPKPYPWVVCQTV